MFKHYLKVSFRNLWKYKYQTLVSVAGLAVGFACFAIATFWIRHEMSYDGFHKNADRLYRVKIKDYSNMNPDGLTTFSDAPLASYLIKTFPEIKNATKIIDMKNDITLEDVTFQANILRTDSSFFKIFDVKLIDGSMDFMRPESNKIAITQEKARQLFGDKSPIGKSIGTRSTICAVVGEFPQNTNYPFDFLSAYDPFYEFNTFGSIVVELVPGIDVKSFMKKLEEYKATAVYQYSFENEDGATEYFSKSVNVLDIFFKEHLTMLVAGALIAFPAGYLIMRRWLENYVLQTEMSAWIYVSILLALFMAIVVCVGGRVYKTSRENPIDSIQKL